MYAKLLFIAMPRGPLKPLPVEPQLENKPSEGLTVHLETELLELFVIYA